VAYYRETNWAAILGWSRNSHF